MHILPYAIAAAVVYGAKTAFWMVRTIIVVPIIRYALVGAILIAAVVRLFAG